MRKDDENCNCFYKFTTISNHIHFEINMQRFITLLQAVLLLTSINTFGQGISSILSLSKPYDVRPGSGAIEITIDKSVIALNDKDMRISEKRYDSQGNTDAQFYFEYDASGKKPVKRVFRKNIPAIGLQTETMSYTYDVNGYLTDMTERNSQNKIYHRITILNDENGLPIELTSYDGNGNIYGMEKAWYDVDNNTVTIAAFNNRNEKTYEGKEFIDDSKKTDRLYNEFGDVIKSGDYEFEYKYDKKNNWTRKVQYKISNGKREKVAEFIRKIKYRKA